MSSCVWVLKYAQTWIYVNAIQIPTLSRFHLNVSAIVLFYFGCCHFWWNNSRIRNQNQWSNKADPEFVYHLKAGLSDFWLTFFGHKIDTFFCVWLVSCFVWRFTLFVCLRRLRNRGIYDITLNFFCCFESVFYAFKHCLGLVACTSKLISSRMETFARARKLIDFSPFRDEWWMNGAYGTVCEISQSYRLLSLNNKISFQWQNQALRWTHSTKHEIISIGLRSEIVANFI